MTKLTYDQVPQFKDGDDVRVVKDEDGNRAIRVQQTRFKTVADLDRQIDKARADMSVAMRRHVKPVQDRLKALQADRRRLVDGE